MLAGGSLANAGFSTSTFPYRRVTMAGTLGPLLMPDVFLRLLLSS
jgi:hypothetical protein